MPEVIPTVLIADIVSSMTSSRASGCDKVITIIARIISDKFINQGNIYKLYEEVGLSPEGIALKIKEFSSER